MKKKVSFLKDLLKECVKIDPKFSEEEYLEAFNSFTTILENAVISCKYISIKLPMCNLHTTVENLKPDVQVPIGFSKPDDLFYLFTSAIKEISKYKEPKSKPKSLRGTRRIIKKYKVLENDSENKDNT